MNTPASQFMFLAGGTEMGERIAAHDWSLTPLGPIAGWPQSLRTAISLILNAQHPMWVGWGPQMTFFYNDAYISVLSLAKHPQALGRPAAEIWKEIWDICGPLADKVFQHGEASFMNDVRLFMNRGDFLEETFYSFSYSPIRDESGNVGGLFCPSAEVTAKVLNTRRLRTLSELAAGSLVEKSPEGACAAAAAILAKNPDDIPFALLYLSDGATLRLTQTVALAAGHIEISPETIDLSGAPGNPPFWPVAPIMRTAQLRVVPLPATAGFPRGTANQPVGQAVLLPVISRGQDRPLGVLILGTNPTRPLDDDYRAFFELVAGHIATAVQNARVAEEDKQRADMLSELDRAKTTFFSNVSHELRTPLTLILGPLEDELRERAGPQERLELAHRNSLRLLKLVNTLLDFSRLEAGRIEASFVPTDLAGYTAELASVFRSGVERAGLRLIVNCPPLPEPVYVDRDMWEKIVFNLLSNALKFTLAGEIEITLGLAAAPGAEPHAPPADGPAPSAVCLSVRDTGTGIPQAELPRIFERFHRVRNPLARSHEGTGIGLALVQELARQHGGSVAVESAEGAGTTFSVWLPRGQAHLPKERIGAARALPPTRSGPLPFVEETLRWLPGNSPAPEDDSPGPALNVAARKLDDRPATSPGPGAGADGYILLADDNSDMRDYIRHLLAGRGHKVVAVENGQAALAAIRECPPALVLSDVMMPRLDGFGLLRELRRDPATNSIPVILISARAGEEARVDGVEAGADDYLTKPFNARELVARVSTHLELARVRRDAAEQIRTTLESVTDGLHVVDRQARFTYLNATARRMMAEHGVDPAGLIGREFFEAFPATRDLEVGRALTRSLRERVPTGTEGFYEPWQRWFNVRHYPTSEGGVSTFFQDVTERRRAEAILRQNEALFSALVELAPMGVYVVDAQFRLQQINARALPAFEKVQPAVGRDFSEVMEILWGPVVSEPIIKIFRHTLATGEHYVSPRFSNVRQDLGEERTYHWETQRMTLPDGQHGVVCYFNDITESTRAEQALLEAKASAERANRSKDLFLAALSHELRTPLTPVLVTVSALREDERLPAEVREQLAMTERNIALEARLIDDLLDLSAIANGKLRLQLQGCDAHPLIRQALEMTQDTALTKEISVACELNASHSGLMMDPVRFQQVVWNLIRNAVKFTPRGGRISIRTTESSPGGGETWFRLEVTDSGIGIEPGSLERIFQPFEQALTAGQHRFGGLGLGLAIVRAIVDLHGGKVFARSDGLNQGATFIAEFRGAVVPSAENGIGSAPHSLAPQPAALNGSGALSGKVRRILLVEDHASTLQALSTLLRRSGYEIAEATTVAEALAQAAAHAFDLVISDLGLPDGTGIQLMDQLRKHHGLRGIALTGYGMEEDVARARAAGFMARLIKPVQINELRTVLTTLG